MSNFSEKQKVNEVAKIELSVRQKQIELEFRSKCIEWAMRTTSPKKSNIVGVESNNSNTPAPEDIIQNAQKYYDFLDK